MMNHPKTWLIISLVTIAASIGLIWSLGLSWGIDFAGGSLLEVDAGEGSPQDIRTALQDGFGLSATVQPTQDGSYLIRVGTIDEARHQEVLAALHEKNLIGENERRFETVGPTIGRELRRKSVTAILLVVVVMMVYLAYTFRTMKGLAEPWKFGAAAVYALIHDLVVVTAVFAVLGKFWGAPVDSLFITAQLAILGYSVNDTIIIFDRLRSESGARRGVSFLDLIDRSIRVTLGRSLNTAFTTLIVLAALLIFGGSTIRWFITALAAGTITGTYSSLFVASPLLYFLSKRK